jgi:hypothetical protein
LEVVFSAHIKKAQNQNGYEIILEDKQSSKVELCKDVEEFSKKIEEMGAIYQGSIDEVRWSKDEDLHPLILDNIRLEMMHIEQEIKQDS